MPVYFDRFHSPPRRAAWAGLMLRAAASMSATASSAAETMLEVGALTTMTPAWVAAFTSTLSRPTPARATTFRRAAAARASASTLVAERTRIASTSAIAGISSVRSAPLQVRISKSGPSASMVAGLSSSAMSTTGRACVESAGALTAGSSDDQGVSRTARRCARLTVPAGPRAPPTRPSLSPPSVRGDSYDGRMGAMDDAERLEPATVEEWSAWLREHHTQPSGVWLVSTRKAVGRAFSYEESVLEALRYGWVDSTVKGVDDDRTMMWFAPRRRGSMWTRINKGRVSRLEEAGLMEPAGAAAGATAKETGMWTLMDDVEDCVVPDDLAAALD